MAMKPDHKALLADLPIQRMIAVVAGLLLSWPIIGIVGERGSIALFLYVFALWGGLIVLLWRIARVIDAQQAATGDADAAANERRERQ